MFELLQVSLLLLTFLLLRASHDNPAASAVATDPAVADVIAAGGFPWVPAVVWSLLLLAYLQLLASLLLLLFLLLLTCQESHAAC